MIQRRKPLARSTKPLKRTPLKRVSKKRAKENRKYMERNRLFLQTHPWCQIWLKKNGFTEDQVESDGDRGWIEVDWDNGNGVVATIPVPRSTEVHHMNGRNGWRLLDETEWCAASSAEHAWVKLNQSEARRIGVLK